jgi:hypothetical protein
MRNVPDKSCREKKRNTFYVQQRSFFNRAVYEVMWKTFVELVKPQVKI